MPGTTEDRGAPRSRWRRLGWFVLLYLVSLAVFGGIVWLARAALGALTPS